MVYDSGLLEQVKAERMVLCQQVNKKISQQPLGHLHFLQFSVQCGGR